MLDGGNNNPLPAAARAAVSFAPFIVAQIVAACCIAADVLVLHSPKYALTAIPIEILAAAYLAGTLRGGRRRR